MMRRLLLIGVCCIAVFAVLDGPEPTSAQQQEEEKKGDGKSLFEVLSRATEKEREVTEAIQSYAVKAAKAQYEITRENVLEAMQSNKQKLCNKKGPDDKQISEVACNDLIETIRRVVTREMNIVRLGRDLQSIATSYELPLRAGQDGEASITTSTMGVLNIWRARGESTAQDGLMRALRLDEKDTEPIAKKIDDAIKELNKDPGIAEEQRKAVVWRYNAGVRLVRDERKPLKTPEEYEKRESPPERQYLFKKWDTIEQPLNQVWDLMKKAEFTPPLKKGEVVIFSLSPKGMPENMRLWGYIEERGNRQYDGDVGLEWVIPVDPVFPSIVKEGGDEIEPILGWDYPPEPVEASQSSSPVPGQEKKPRDGRSLCNGPFARLGYLCREMDEESGIDCSEDEAGKQDTIYLTKCTEKVPPRPKPPKENQSSSSGTDGETPSDPSAAPPKQEPKRQTITGPDVCRDIDWQEGGFDAQHDCKIEITCEEKCAETQSLGAVTFLKDGQGVIKICMEKDGIEFPATYLLYHELVHAQQFCRLPVGVEAVIRDAKKLKEMTPQEIERENIRCCQVEGEGNAAQCALLEQDGVFLNADGSRKESTSGIPFDAETCTEALRYMSCSGQGGVPEFKGCTTSRYYDDSFVKELYQAMKNNVADVPESCEDSLKYPDVRMEALLDSIEKVENVCDPGNTTQFQNSIAGTLCLVGACAETSLETRSPVPGRAGLLGQDEVFPWESDLEKEVKGGTFLLGIPESSTSLPSYNPRLLLQQIDADLCQQVGLPPQSPSVLCILEARRRFGTAPQDFIQLAQGLISNANEQATAISQREVLSMATGVRMGTALYVQEVRRLSLSLGELMRTAERLLKALKDTPFPNDMCQVGA